MQPVTKWNWWIVSVHLFSQFLTCQSVLMFDENTFLASGNVKNKYITKLKMWPEVEWTSSDTV